MNRDDINHLIITGVKITGLELGRGAYGRVFAVDYNGITCAAKEIHSVLLNQKAKKDETGRSIDQIRQIKQDFLKECLQHSKLHHPNIVKMLGVYYPSDQAVLPVLVMERMEFNLTQLLKKHLGIPMYVKLSILQDVSRGICYLHTLNPPLIHCDLTSNNILFSTNLVAKICDFVVIKVFSPLSKGYMPKIPGTLDFMPQEVFEGNPHDHYVFPLDIFSFGCVVCHVITQRWPEPSVLSKVNPVSDVERRKRYINEISDRSLKELVMQCLDNDRDKRPSISAVTKKITDIIKDNGYSNDDSIKEAYSLALKEGEAEPRDLQLLLLGAENTGKTCLISSFLGEKFVVKQPATEGAETKVCKIHSKNWSRITDTDKTELLHDQFIDQFRGNALKMMLPLKSHMNSAFSSHKLLTECTEMALTDSPNTPITSSTSKDLPEQCQSDVAEASSNTIQYDADTLNTVLWDFPGQVIFHNSHSVFISESGVPVITFNASQKLTDKILPRDGSPQPAECCTVISNIQYWLQVVDSMCSVKENVLLAGTHIDKIHRNIKRAREIAKEKILLQLEQELCKKPYAHCLFGYSRGIASALQQCCYFVSNKCRDEEIGSFKNAIIIAARSLRKKQPIFFLKIERELLQHSEPIISKNTMLNLIAKVSIPVAENSSELEGILNYFHNKRTILYFSQINSLKDLVILSPYWLGKLFSYVIAAFSYQTQGIDIHHAWERLTKYGILEDSLLEHMLNKFKSDYHSTEKVTKEQVVDILLSFHLIARIKRTAWFSEEQDPFLPDHGDVFIVPSLARRGDRKSIPNTKQERIIYFKFKSGFIPSSLLNQLIADCICRNVNRNDRLLWMRYGKVGLQLGHHQKYYISRCEEMESIKLTITVVGDDIESVGARKELIHDVNQSLDKIMKVFMPEAKKPIPMVSCPSCHQLHITLDEVYSCTTIFCPTHNDVPLPSDFCRDLTTSGSCNPTSTQRKAERMLEVFTNHYGKLQNILLVQNLSGYFVASRIITFDEENTIQQTVGQIQAATIVLRKIANSLQAGQTDSFVKLLKIMKNHGGLSCEQLADQINAELSENTSSTAAVTCLASSSRKCIIQ